MYNILYAAIINHSHTVSVLCFPSVIAERNITTASHKVFIHQILISKSVESPFYLFIFFFVWVSAGSIDYPTRCCTGTLTCCAEYWSCYFHATPGVGGSLFDLQAVGRLAVSLLQQCRVHMADLITGKQLCVLLVAYGLWHWGCKNMPFLTRNCQLCPLHVKSQKLFSGVRCVWTLVCCLSPQARKTYDLHPAY